MFKPLVRSSLAGLGNALGSCSRVTAKGGAVWAYLEPRKGIWWQE